MKDLSNSKSNVNFLLTANVDEFELESALEAKNELADALDDLTFQLELPESEFQGVDYVEWRKKAAYKKNRVAYAYRRFKTRIKTLQRIDQLGWLQEAVLDFLEELPHNIRATPQAELLYIKCRRIPTYL